MSKKITESSSNYDNLEQMSVGELLRGIHEEDKKILPAVEKVIPILEKLIVQISERMKNGGRLFYIGAGTSGRLGILDASEIPPTFGLDSGVVIGLIAGGEKALRSSVESAEDDPELCWKELQAYNISNIDTVIGIAASGSTPYVVGGIRNAKSFGALTACITNNPDTILAREADIPVEVIVGPEFISGSTRMKAGTSQKLILNMITTSLMIQLGRIKGNKMVNMQLNNHKLFERGIAIICEETKLDRAKAAELLKKYQSVNKVLEVLKNTN